MNKKQNLEAVPGVTFTTPSIATVGLTEQQAKEKGIKVKTSVLPLDAVPRAIVNRETTGVFKLIVDANSLKVLGVDRKSTRLNSSHVAISYAVFCLKKKNKNTLIKHSYKTEYADN